MLCVVISIVTIRAIVGQTRFVAPVISAQARRHQGEGVTHKGEGISYQGEGGHIPRREGDLRSREATIRRKTQRSRG